MQKVLCEKFVGFFVEKLKTKTYNYALNCCKECRKIDTEYLLDFVKILNGELSSGRC